MYHPINADAFPPKEQTPESRTAESKGMCILNLKCHHQILSPKDAQFTAPPPPPGAVRGTPVSSHLCSSGCSKFKIFSNPLGKKMRLLFICPLFWGMYFIMYQL